ncbi:acyltransferase [Mangrovibacterium lignilyticum]|uniref:acyltransferase n=1 Tax=Mangrovibacterium lignilyticum TaxID=2668052 RepID=UPI0013D773B3|nr:acyltransferase [Mangrovibacterium lignilyticum]
MKNMRSLLKTPIRVIQRAINKWKLADDKIKVGKDWQIVGILKLSNHGRLVIGNNFKANSGKNANPIGGDIILRMIVGKDAQLIIGDNVGISNSTIVCSTSIKIEDKVLIGGGCKFYDTDFHSLSYENRIGQYTKGIKDQYVLTAPIHIKEGAWIGGHCIVLKGVTIGKKSIIGAGSVVTKNIPDNEIWGGNPAQFIRKV